MSSPWTVASNVVFLNDETNWKVRVGPAPVPPSPPSKLEVVGNTLITLQDKGGNVFDVKAFGAVGDGVADDRAAVQAAVNAMPAPGPNAQGGGTLYFPPGNYKLSKTPLQNYAVLIQDKPVLVQGAGPEASTISMTSPSSRSGGIRVRSTASWSTWEHLDQTAARCCGA